MVIEKTNINAWKRTGREFVGRSGVCIWKAKTTVNTNIRISGMSEEKREIGSSVGISSRRSNI
jgi:hypothetical protein